MAKRSASPALLESLPTLDGLPCPARPPAGSSVSAGEHADSDLFDAMFATIPTLGSHPRRKLGSIHSCRHQWKKQIRLSSLCAAVNTIWTFHRPENKIYNASSNSYALMSLEIIVDGMWHSRDPPLTAHITVALILHTKLKNQVAHLVV